MNDGPVDPTLGRSFNLKGFLLLVLAILCLGGMVYLVHRFQIKRNAGELLDLVAEAEAKGDSKRAVDLMETYLALKPQDAAAQARYGFMLAKRAKTLRTKFEAYEALEQAMRMDLTRLDVRRELIRIALAYGRYSDALEHLAILQETFPDDGELDRLKAQCYSIQGQFEQADGWLAKAIRDGPDQLENYRLRAALLRQHLRKRPEADQVIRDMIRANPRSLPMRLEAARYFVQNHLWDEADQSVQHALKELNARDVEVFLLAADVDRLGKKDPGQGRQYLAQALQFHPDDTHVVLSLAGLEIGQGHKDEALQLLHHALDHLPPDPEFLARLTAMLIDVGEFDKTTDLLKELDGQGQGPLAETLRARILAIQGDWGRARLLLENNAYLIQAPQWAKNAYLLLAQTHRILRNPDGQMKAFRQVLQQDPYSVEAQVELAALEVHFGKRDDAMEHYRQVLQQDPSQEGAQVEFASLLARSGKRAEAIEHYRQLLSQSPQLSLRLAQLLIQKNQVLPGEKQDWSEVEKVLDQLPKELRSSAQAQVVRASLLEARHQPKEARRLLEEERIAHPGELIVWTTLAGVVYRQEKMQAACQVLDEAEKHLGKRPELMLSRVFFTLSLDNATARQALRGLEAGLERFSQDDRRGLVCGLAEAYHQLGDNLAARRCWRRAAELRPQDLSDRLPLLELAIQDKDEKELQRLLDEIRPLEGEGGPLWSYGEAARLFLQVKDKDKDAHLVGAAMKHLALAREQRPNWAPVALLQGHLLRLQGQADQALEQYRHAIEDLGERDPGLIRLTVDMLYQQRRFEDVQNLLRRVSEEALADSPELLRLGAELALTTGDLDQPNPRALEKARLTVPEDSSNYQDFVWLGMIAQTAKQPAEADRYFRKALQLANRAPETWVTLILALARTDPKRAEAGLEEARLRLPKDVLPQVLASCYEGMGQLEQALKQYEAMLAAKPNDPEVLFNVSNFYSRQGQSALAEASWRKLMDPASKASQPIQAWARRQVALTLANNGEYRKFKEALSLLEVNRRHQVNVPADELVHALVLSSQPAHRREAITYFERHIQTQTLLPEEHFRLAQLYDAAGEWGKARPEYQAAAMGKKKNLQFLAYYAQRLLNRDEIVLAEILVRDLETSDPYSWRSVALKTQWLRKKGKISDAVQCVQDHGKGHPEQAFLVAGALEELGQVAEAEAEYRRFISASNGTGANKPEYDLVLAQFLGRRQRIPEALELCDQAWQTCPPELVAEACLNILSTGSALPVHFQTVEDRLETALKKKPKATDLLRIQAQLHEIQGHLPQAVDLFQKILQREPEDTRCLNNLAYYLSFEEARVQEALTLIQRAIELAGPMAELLDTRALIHLAMKQPEAALQDLQEALKQNQAAAYYFHLAVAHQQNRHLESALEAWHKAKDLKFEPQTLNPLEKPAYQRLAAEFETTPSG